MYLALFSIREFLLRHPLDDLMCRLIEAAGSLSYVNYVCQSSQNLIRAKIYRQRAIIRTVALRVMQR
jgi:hypothetical protein